MLCVIVWDRVDGVRAGELKNGFFKLGDENPLTVHGRVLLDEHLGNVAKAKARRVLARFISRFKARRRARLRAA